MREIEFRAWLKENYLERYGWDKRAEELGRMRKVHSIHLNKKKIIISCEYGGNISVPFQYIELMQWTGLKDKNGVKIFEGDVVKCKVYSIDNETWEIDDVGKVVYDDDCCAYFIQFNEGYIHLTSAWNLNVIGNIYENPELLENY